LGKLTIIRPVYSTVYRVSLYPVHFCSRDA